MEIPGGRGGSSKTHLERKFLRGWGMQTKNLPWEEGKILPRGKMPRRHPYSSHVYKVKGSKVLTVKIYSRYIYIYIYIYHIKSQFARTGRARNKWVMMRFHH